ncbi:PaaI family thioesterase [Streptomyces massasporeus]|uniref:PaaI family thioesterase n=1 Tax=Streptomyces massasporeus TaxID=67324 RepID=UPI0033C0D902
MGWACATAGMPGMTVSLQMPYQRPVPLEVPLRVRAHVTGTEGRKVYVAGSITTEEDPSTVLVAAEGVFVTRPRARPSPVSRVSMALTARRSSRAR